MSKKWHIHGDYLLGCNCDYGCPCNFNAPPTKGFCEGAIGFRVEDGAYNGVRLDGLSTFIGVKWPGAIHEGNGTASIYIDEKASAEQRDALIKIISGEAGKLRLVITSVWPSRPSAIRYPGLKRTQKLFCLRE
jgi:hypothetical protein